MKKSIGVIALAVFATAIMVTGVVAANNTELFSELKGGFREASEHNIDKHETSSAGIKQMQVEKMQNEIMERGTVAEFSDLQ